MGMRTRHELFIFPLKLSLFVLTIHILIASSHAQSSSNPPDIFMDNACVRNLGYIPCMESDLGPKVAPRLYWAAIAISPFSLTVGGAHGRDSESEAQETALQNCGRNGAKDCKVLTSAGNHCVAMAVSYSDRSYGYDGEIGRAHV